MPEIVSVKDLVVKYNSRGYELLVLDGLSFSIEEKKFTCLVGPSGCGKTTLLRCLSGLQKSSSGNVVVVGKQMFEPIDEMTLVFQDYTRSLLPWRTVLGNVKLGIEGKFPKKESERRCRELLSMVGLLSFENFYPWQLSGGMQQRVAIARALAPEPKILLMDEPFASVDAQTRMVLEDQLLSLWQKLGLTVLFVTHDIDEAVYLSERVIILCNRPTKVVDDVVIELDQPRNQIETRNTPAFAGYRSRILSEVSSFLK